MASPYCSICAVGRYSPGLLAQCHNCEIGKFAPVEKSSICASCETQFGAGYSSREGSGECATCLAPDYYRDSDDNTCQPCE